MGYSNQNIFALGAFDVVNDAIQKLLKKLLATEDPAEFDALSSRLNSILHERIEQLRAEARALGPKLSELGKKTRAQEIQP